MSSFRGFDTQLSLSLLKPKSQLQKVSPKGNLSGVGLGIQQLLNAPGGNRNVFNNNTSPLKTNLPCRSKNDSTTSNGILDEIHSKLHADLNKIKIWKVNVDHELKQKTHKLEASSQIIESQRKSILDLQLENEKISLRLKEELDGRKEFEQRHQSTRELMFVVKEQFTSFEEKINSCHNLKMMFDGINEEQCKDIETMISKFENLAIDFNQKMESMNEKYMTQVSEKVQMKASLSEQINNAQSQIASLTNSLEMKESDLQKLNTELADLDVTKSSLKEENEKCFSSISVMNKDIQEKSAKLDSILQEVTDLSSEKQELKTALEEVKKLLESQINTHEILVAEYNSHKKKHDLHSVQSGVEKQELVNKLSTTSKQFQDTEKELKDSVNTIETLKSNIDLLKMGIAEQKNLVQDLQVKIEQTKCERDELQDKLAKLENNLRELKNSVLKNQGFEAELIETKKLLESEMETNGELKLSLDNAVDNAKMHQECVVHLKDELKCLLEEVDNKLLTLKLKDTEVKKLNIENKELNEKLSVMMVMESSAKVDAENVRNELKSLIVELNTSKEVQLELEKKFEICVSQIADHTRRLEEALENNAEKEFLISELQQKLDDKCASQTTEKSENCNAILNLEKKIKALEDELLNSTKRVNEFETINTSLEEKVEEALETIAEKESSISELKQKFDDMCASQSTKEGKISTTISNLEKKIKTLKEELSTSTRRVKELEKLNTALEKKVDRYVQTIVEKESTISELQEKLDATCSSQSTKKNETSKAISNLENQMKSLKEELSNSTKKVKELEKVNTSLEKKLLAKTKALMKSSHEMTDLCAKLNEKSDEITGIKKDLKNANAQLEDYKRKIDQSARDLDECKYMCESRIGEYIQMLSKSETISNKTFMEKNEQLRETKYQLEKLQRQTRVDEEKDREIKQLNAKIDELGKDNLVSEKKHIEQQLIWEKEKMRLMNQINATSKDKEELVKVNDNLLKTTMATQRSEWEKEKHILLAKCNSYQNAQTLSIPRTPLGNIQPDTTRTTIRETPTGRIQTPSSVYPSGKILASTPQSKMPLKSTTPNAQTPLINIQPETTRTTVRETSTGRIQTPSSVYPSGKILTSTPQSKAPLKNATPNIQGITTPRMNIPASNSYLATPRSTPNNYGNNYSESKNIDQKANQSSTPRINAKGNRDNVTPLTNTVTPTRGCNTKMMPKKVIPVDLGFDSDSSSASANGLINSMLNSGIGLKRKSPTMTKSPYRQGKSKSPEPRGHSKELKPRRDAKKTKEDYEQDIFGSLNSKPAPPKRGKPSAPLVKPAAPIARKFFKTDRNAVVKKAEPAPLSWFEKGSAYNLFNED